MRFYFLSDYPCAIKIGGLYFGQINPLPKTIELNLNDKPFVEICPIEQTELPFSFVLTKDFLANPTEVYSVTDLDGGYFLSFFKTPKQQDFRILAQERFPDLLTTVFVENGVKISIETNNGFFAEELKVIANSAEILRFKSSNNNLLLVSLQKDTDNTVVIYLLDNPIRRVFSDSVRSFSLDEGFCTETYFNDTLKHVVKTNYDFSSGKPTILQKHISSKKNFYPEKTPDLLIPYMFMEELQIGGDVSIYLDDSILNEKNKLNSYFGAFIGVMPPPFFKNSDDVGVIYKEKEFKYYVKYACFELKNKKIINFKLS